MGDRGLKLQERLHLVAGQLVYPGRVDRIAELVLECLARVWLRGLRECRVIFFW